MINICLPKRTARLLSRAGFTLVELLVVIGIIAILAGVALGPITAGIKKAQQSSGVQTTRTLALSEFTYANDNGQTYPYGVDSAALAAVLLNGNYISDTGIFYIGGSKETKFSGTAASTILTSNISYDFGVLGTVGISANAPDQMPVVLSCVANKLTTLSSVGPITTPVAVTNPFGTAGVAVCYKSNSAKFLTSANSSGTYNSTICDGSFPGAGTGATTVQGGG